MDAVTSAAAPLSAADVAAALRLHPPTPEQAAVIEAPPQPLLVVAGAGSGKTETMAARVVWLVANGLVAPESVLGLTFTRKAAGELAERVRARLRALAAAGMMPLVTGPPGPPGEAFAAGGPGARDAPGTGTDTGSGPDDVSVSTYHSYAATVVADHGMRAGIEPGARLLGEAAAWQLASSVVEGWDDLGDLESAPSTVTAAVLSLAGECAEHLVGPDDVDAHLGALAAFAAAVPGRVPARLRDALAVLATRRRLLPLVRAYGRRKRELDVLDHGDQVALAARLAAGVPEVAEIERARWGVVLLDEYQDTSSAQSALLRSLFGGGHPVTAVGDPHQSIYGWRGASAGGLEEFPARFPRADGAPAAVVALSTSWRNDVAVLDAAAAVAAPLRAASRLPLPELAARPGAGAGRVDVGWYESAAEEAEALAGALATAWHADSRAGLGPGEHRTMAVLCRTRAQFGPLEEALRARGLPVEVVGVGGLLARPEVMDVVAALRAVADPSRGDAVLRLATGPRWRLGPRDLRALAAWSRHTAGAVRATAGRGAEGSGVEGRGAEGSGVDGSGLGGSGVDAVDGASLADALDALPPPGWVDAEGTGLSAAARERLTDLAGVLGRVRDAASSSLPEVVAQAERALGLDVEVAARPGVAPADARAHLEALADAAAAFESEVERASLPAFLGWLDAAAVHERGLEAGDGAAGAGGVGDGGDAGGAGGVEPSRSAVQLLTVHAAKGLEWDVVAVPGLVHGAFPSAPRGAGGWLSGLGALPYPLRGDAGSLPVLAWDTAADAAEMELARSAFVEACARHSLAEERRLAYVAITRARSHLLLSGAWWGSTGLTCRQPSTFLVEVAEHLRELGHAVPELPDQPEQADNPALREPRRTTWPADPLGERRADVESAAAAVRAAAGAAGPAGSAPPSAWDDEVDRLLAERAVRGRGEVLVTLPAHLSASRLVDLAADPSAVALAVRRPVPARPHEATRRGTLFHAWLEQRFRAQALWDLDDASDPSVDTALEAATDGSGDGDGPGDGPRDGPGDGPRDGPGDGPRDGPGDDPGVGPGDGLDTASLRASFLASEWADRTPVAVEVDLETPLAGLVVRCRVDAVFARPDGGVDVVDWKTGVVPTGDRARAAAVQLAVYRLAWSRLHGVPLHRVGAAFFYAAAGRTSRPVDLLDAAGLEWLVTNLPVAGTPAPSPPAPSPPARA